MLLDIPATRNSRSARGPCPSFLARLEALQLALITPDFKAHGRALSRRPCATPLSQRKGVLFEVPACRRQDQPRGAPPDRDVRRSERHLLDPGLVDAGVSAYNVDGFRKERIKSSTFACRALTPLHAAGDVSALIVAVEKGLDVRPDLYDAATDREPVSTIELPVDGVGLSTVAHSILRTSRPGSAALRARHR